MGDGLPPIGRSLSMEVEGVTMPRRRRKDSIVFTRMNDEVDVPVKKTALACGYDITMHEPVLFRMGKVTTFSLGLKVTLPERSAGRLTFRSSFAMKYPYLRVIGGDIDADYRGELHCMILNGHSHDLRLPKGLRFAQMIVYSLPDEDPDVYYVDNTEYPTTNPVFVVPSYDERKEWKESKDIADDEEEEVYENDIRSISLPLVEAKKEPEESGAHLLN